MTLPRIAIEMSSDELDRIQALDPDRTPEEIIKDSLALLEELAHRTSLNERIISYDDATGDFTVLKSSFLDAARGKTHQSIASNSMFNSKS